MRAVHTAAMGGGKADKVITRQGVARGMGRDSKHAGDDKSPVMGEAGRAQARQGQNKPS